MNLTELLEEVQLTKIEDVKLYFVTRASKVNVSKRTPAKDKYLFNVFQMGESLSPMLRWLKTI